MTQKSLDNIRVIDLSRVLAGPYCTQMLGDLGAEIIKIERPEMGDDTRKWGPPYLKDSNGHDTTESAYYLSCNRNKRSLSVDITTIEGQEIIHKLLEDADILIENFKVGGLKKYGLDFESVQKRHPHIVYASITGFGQNGPLASEPGYDYLAQAMSGLMACTGEAEGEPMKVGVALSDIITGLNAAIGILAALHHRQTSGKGQHIDVGLLDCTLASLTNIAQYYLTSGKIAPRLGNAHSTIVPYQVFEAKDGHIVLAIGNDRQFARFCNHIGKDEWINDDRFAANSARVANRDTLVPMISEIISGKTIETWLNELQDIDVPCGPVNTMDKTFDMEQIAARNMKIQMNHPQSSSPIDLVGSPIKMSDTPPSYVHAPPSCGEHTDDILTTMLKLSAEEIAALRDKKVI